MFGATVDVRAEQRARAFTVLRRLVVAHETTDEQIVHPRARHEPEDGQVVVSARLGEKQAVVRLFGLWNSSVCRRLSLAFDEGIRALQQSLVRLTYGRKRCSSAATDSIQLANEAFI